MSYLPGAYVPVGTAYDPFLVLLCLNMENFPSFRKKKNNSDTSAVPEDVCCYPNFKSLEV